MTYLKYSQVTDAPIWKTTSPRTKLRVLMPGTSSSLPYLITWLKKISSRMTAVSSPSQNSFTNQWSYTLNQRLNRATHPVSCANQKKVKNKGIEYARSRLATRTHSMSQDR